MPTSFLPNKDAALLAWSLNFTSKIGATPLVFGLTAPLATAYQALHDSFASAMENCDPDERNKVATATKNDARFALKNNARLLAKLVDGTASVTDPQKLELGLTVKAQPSPQPVPANAPGVGVV